MDLVLLRSLLAVADAGTITDAADELAVSQSALSRRLQQLERDLGAYLLVRGRHGVELTEMGRQAADEGRAIVARYDQLRQNLLEYQGLRRGTVRVGGGATVTSYLLPPAIAEFQSRHPGLRFVVKEAGSHQIASEVSAGSLELGIVTLPVAVRDLDITDRFVDEIVLAARADHPILRQRISARDLDGKSFVGFESGSAIRHIIDDRLRAAGVEIDVGMELRSIPSILQMVVTTGSLAFVSRAGLRTEPGVQAVPVRGLSISRTLGVVRRRGFPLSGPADSFAAVLREVLPATP